MAGHARRGADRAGRMRRRLAAAQTAEEQLAVAFDWFRASVSHADPAERARRMREVSEFLVTRISEEEALNGHGQ